MTPTRRDVLIAAGASSAVLMTRSGFGQQAALPGPYTNASALVAALHARTVSSAELVEQAISRIEALDTRINAVVVRDFDRARANAREADAALARGDRRPLLGVPITVKEAFNVAGLTTTWGSPNAKDYRATEDAVAVARLKAAGAIVLGKTNVPTGILAFWETRNDLYGKTSNPWDLTRTPGGSSGGSAAALAAGFVPLELGSDLGGSLRGPAHFCGVFGHKPTALLVAFRGHVRPRAPALETTLSAGLAVPGPLARSASDLSLALDVLAGPDESDAVGYRVSLPPPRQSDLRAYRVLIVDTHPILPLSDEVRSALHDLGDRLAAAGVKVARSSPLLPDLAEASRLRTRMVSSFTSIGRPPEYYQKMRAQLAALPAGDNGLQAMQYRGILMSHHEWMEAEVQRALLRAQCRKLFKEFDVVLSAPYWAPAPLHDPSPLAGWEDRPIEINGRRFPLMFGNTWSHFATVTGLPATVAPNGKSRAGLPIGVEIIGPYLEDRTPIAFAGLLEREFGGFVPPPDLG